MTFERDVLPANVKPVHYDLTIVPDLEKFTFTGSVTIELKIVNATKEIQLNACELVLHSASVKTGNSVQKSSSISLDEKTEVAKLAFENELSAGQTALLSITFDGIINDKMAGFYRSGYQSGDKKKYMGVTQFEATDARRAFPCWDEPALKATFSINISSEKGLVSLSNMNVVEKKDDPERAGRELYKFAKTPVMSTYLVAWAVAELEYIEDKTKEGVQVRVYTLPGESSQGKFALYVAKETLSFFTSYFATPYPLPKMDLIAVPDFGAGAMENWGLVTYRNMYLLFDENGSSTKTKQNVAYVVGHELAHQWFGNLVTMEWWSDLWLNEGFATWVGWLAVDNLFPEWQVWVHFINDDQQRGLSLDGLRSSHPIQVPVRNPSEINQIFDAISYSKGASVIRMLVHYLGEETFKKGIQAYLKKHQYANASTSDLWASLSEASGKPVQKMMSSWTEQLGYPVLKVDRNCNDKKCVCLKQNRFLRTGDVQPADDTNLWYIPYALTTDTGAKNDGLLTEREGKVEVPADAKLIKFNSGQHGFYRVLYSDELLNALTENLALGEKSLLSNEDRVGLIGDAFALSIAGSSSTVSALKLIKKYGLQDGYIVWSEITGNLSTLLSAWWEQPQKAQDDLSRYLRSVYGPLADKLGFEFKADESDIQHLLRNLIIAVAGKNGHESTVNESKKRFEAFIGGDEKALHPTIRGSVFQIVLKHGGDKAKKYYEEVYGIYKKSKLTDQKLAALSSLGSVADLDLLQRTLDLAVNEEEVRPQDIMTPIGSVAVNPKGRLLAWKFFQANYQLFHDRYYKGSTAILSRLITFCTSDLGTLERVKDIENFFRDKETTSVKRSIAQSIEKIQMTHKWTSRDSKAVNEWLATQ